LDKLGEMAMFVRVVDAGSFSAAARALHLTPSAVSKQISRLEGRLDARLLQRTTRRLHLTEEGRAFYERSVRIVAEIAEAEEAVNTLHATPQGTLRVNATVAFAKHQVVPRLPAFLARYPQLRIELELTDRSVDLVEEGLDVAIRLEEQMTDSSLVARRLAVNRRVICASPAYLEANGIPETPDDLLNHNCLTLSARETFNDWEFEDDNGSRTLRVGGNFEANHGDALHEAVLAGIGLARLATYLVAPDIHAGRLVPLLVDYAHEKNALYVVYPHRRHLSSKVRAFVDFLVEAFTPVPPWEKDAPHV